MTANQKRNAVANQYKKILGRNIYSQDMNQRECVYKPYKDGKFYSDCSSSVRNAYKEADIGLDYIGGNTCGIYSSKYGMEIKTTIKNGVPINVKDLRVGDAFLFAGTDSSRSEYEFCGHIEMVYSIKGKVVTLSGHGSNTPSTKNMVTYCTSRYNSKTNTKLGNKGLVKIVRFIEDDMKTTIKEKIVNVVKPIIKHKVAKPTITPTEIKYSYEYYKVKAGDNLSKIAKKYNTTVDKLVKLNNIKNANEISIGQKLLINTYKSYTVVKGDSLSKISKEFLNDGNRFKEIMLLNNLKSTSLDIGQILKIPN